MRTRNVILVFSLVASAMAMASVGPDDSRAPGTAAVTSEKPAEPEALRCARRRSEKAESASSREDKRRLSMEGLACGERCAIEFPGETRCAYYLGVNRGLLLETNLVNPKFHIRRLVSDFKLAVELDEGYDAGGALRALGYIFLRLPAMGLWGREEYSRDLKLAEEYARRALLVGGEHPENLRLAGEVSFAREHFKEALGYFKKTLKVVKKSGIQEDEKDELVPELEKWIAKAKKKMK